MVLLLSVDGKDAYRLIRQRPQIEFDRGRSDGECLQDQVRDRIGVRDQRQVARLNLDRLRTHPLGHETLQVGIDRSVLGGHGIEGGLAAPGGIRPTISHGDLRFSERAKLALTAIISTTVIGAGGPRTLAAMAKTLRKAPKALHGGDASCSIR